MSDKDAARFERFSENCPDCGGTGEFERFYGGGVYPSSIDCEKCLGKGRLGNCTGCGGTGVIITKGVPSTEEPCQACNGIGAVGDCPDCAGTGALCGEVGKECPSCDGYGFRRS